MHESKSIQAARAAARMALSRNREEEAVLKREFEKQGVRVAAVDYGGDLVSSVKTIVERSVVAAKRERVIRETYQEIGAVAGAAREAVSQIVPRAFGLNVGGKIGIARNNEDVSVAIFCGIGLLHLNEVAMGLGHRAISRWQAVGDPSSPVKHGEEAEGGDAVIY